MLRWLCLALPVAVGAFAVHARPARLSLHPEMRPLPPRTANANMGLNLDSRIYLALDSLDKVALRPVVRLANHAPALASLAYFGLISSTMMNMAMGAGSSMPMVVSLKDVIIRAVGPTSNARFSAIFPTLVTPANFVFLIWPVIALLQLVTLSLSIFRPAKSLRPNPLTNRLQLWRLAGGPLSQPDLSSLAVANGCATAWLLIASNALAKRLPLGSVLMLPLVALFSGLPLRSGTAVSPEYRPVFQVFSSFTTIAAFLAVAVELQHGGRVPALLAQAEPAACVFVGLFACLLSLPRRCMAKRAVNVLALSGILVRRLAPLTAVTTTSALALLRSPSFVGVLACWGVAVKQLVDQAVGKLGARAPAPRPAAARKKEVPTTQSQADRPDWYQRGGF